MLRSDSLKYTPHPVQCTCVVAKLRKSFYYYRPSTDVLWVECHHSVQMKIDLLFYRVSQQVMSVLTGQKICYFPHQNFGNWIDVLCNVWAPNKNLRPCKVPHNCSFSLLSPDKLVKDLRALQKRIYAFSVDFSEKIIKRFSTSVNAVILYWIFASGVMSKT